MQGVSFLSCTAGGHRAVLHAKGPALAVTSRGLVISCAPVRADRRLNGEEIEVGHETGIFRVYAGYTGMNFPMKSSVCGRGGRSAGLRDSNVVLSRIC